MKKHLKTKILITPAFIACILAPVLLSSCASVSQYYLPIMIGGNLAEQSPFKLLRDNDPSFPTTQDNIPGFIKDETDNTYNSYNAKYADYLPNSYISYTNRSANTTTPYGWTAPENLDYWNATTPIESDGQVKPANYDHGWYTPTDSQLAYLSSPTVNGKDKTDAMTSIQNYNTAALIQASSGIASAASSLNNGLVSFMSQTGVMDNKEAQKYYDALFTPTPDGTGNGLNHGTKNDPDQSTNKSFYEFLFDLADLLGQGKTTTKFSESGTQFYFNSSSYGPGPFISPANEGYGTTLTDLTANFGSQPANMSDVSWTGLPWNVLPEADKTKIAESLYDEYPTMFSRTIFTADKNETTSAYAPTTFGASVPFLIQPGDNQYSFYNPLKDMGMNPSDYLLNSIDPVAKQVTRTNVWKSFSKYVNTEKDSDYNNKNTWAQTLSWNVDTKNANTNQSFFSNLTTANMKAATDPTKAAHIDPCISKLFDDSSKPSIINSNINQNTYIGFANYSIYKYPSWNGNEITYQYLPVFANIQTASNGLPAIFPIELLTKLDSTDGWDGTSTSSVLDFDPSVLTASLIPELNYMKTNITDFKDINSDAPENKIFYFDIDAIAAKEKKWLDFLNQADSKHRIKSDMTYNDLDKEYKRYMAMTALLFGTYDGSAWQPTSSFDLFKPLK